MNWRKEQGQDLVELALILPLLLALVLGVLDSGRLFGAYIDLKNVSREGARYATLHASEASLAAVQSIAVAEAAASGLTGLGPSDITVVPGDPGLWRDGTPVSVSVRYPFQFLTSIPLGGPSIDLQATTVMAVVSGK